MIEAGILPETDINEETDLERNPAKRVKKSSGRVQRLLDTLDFDE